MTDFTKAYRTIMDDDFPPEVTIDFGGQKLQYRKRTWKLEDEGQIIEKGLRYGENPGQQAALYELVGGALNLGGVEFIRPGNSLVSGISEQDLIQFGKHPGKINLTDLDNALNILRYLDAKPCCAIMKHNNPSGVAWGSNPAEAYTRAYFSDRIAAFGGCVVFNRPVDIAAAKSVAEQYAEVVAAPEYEQGAVAILAKRKNLRIIRLPGIADIARFAPLRFVDIKSLIDGGIVVQQSFSNRIRSAADFIPAEGVKDGKPIHCKRAPTEAELDDLVFAWAVEAGVSSNSVLYVKDGATVSIGTGEQDRVGVTKIAIDKAYLKFADTLIFKRFSTSIFAVELEIKRGLRKESDLEDALAETRAARGGLKGSVMVSDAFFPFRDSVDMALEQGITAIAQPGGSLRDWESIEACNEADPPVAMVYTGQRSFKH
ncbi:MAG: IMP cyclohydrolase [Candidatus Brocadiia bacterium]